MRFLKSGGNNNDLEGTSENQFFITENIMDSHPFGDSKIIQEERSQQESEMEAVQEDEESEQEEVDENYDFGRAKMDYFK